MSQNSYEAPGGSRNSSQPQPNTNGTSSSTLPNPLHYSHQHVNQNHTQNDPYQNGPQELTRVYPFATYMPTARAASHISPHNVTYPLPSSSSSVYPQYAGGFAQMDNPQNQADWGVREQARMRLSQMLQNSGGQGYTQSYMQNQEPISYPSTPTSYHPGQPVQPLPYSLLPQFSGEYTHQFPTPTSMADGPTSGGSQLPATEFFQQFIDTTLGTHHDSSSIDHQPTKPSQSQVVQPTHIRASSITSTPTISRAVSRMALTPGESPDPLSGTPQSHHRPSPTKRRKSDKGTAYPLSPIRPLHTGQAFPKSTSNSRQPYPSPSPSRKLVVEIPIKTEAGKAHASISDGEDYDSGDELQWGDDGDGDGDWNMNGNSGSAFASPSGKAYLHTSMRATGSVKTGDRDMRTIFEKLQTLLEDIFEESDSLPAEPTSSDLSSSKYHSHLSKDVITPLLSDQATEQIIRYITRVHIIKRKAKGKDEIPQWDEEALKRLFRLLERNIREGENIVVFPEDRKAVATIDKEKNKKGGGGAGGRKKSKKGSKSPERDIGEMGYSQNDDQMTEEELTRGEEALETTRSACLAAECLLVCLDAEGLSKPLYSEDLLAGCVAKVKDALSKVIYPVLEGLAGEKISSRYLSNLVTTENETKKAKSKQLSSSLFANPYLSNIARSALSCLQHLASLLSRQDLAFGDSLVIQTVYLAISPLFVNGPGGKVRKGSVGKVDGHDSLMKGLRMEALGLLRSAFAKYEEQRQWIIEEILSSLVKLPDQSSQTRFQLSNGSSIHTITALLLQLIQASAYGVTSRVAKLRSSALDLEIQSEGKEKPDMQEEESRICGDAIDASLRSARVVAGYLVQKSGTTKAQKSSHDTDYKLVLDTFISDLLNVLYRPEWPAASLYLSVFTRLFISAVEDQLSGQESSAMKNIALDYLGDIATKLKGIAVDLGVSLQVSLDQVIALADVSAGGELVRIHKQIAAFLSAASREDSMYNSALEMSNIIWAQELHAATKKAVSVAEKLSAEKDEESQEVRQKLQELEQMLRSALRDVWLGDEGLFEVIDPKQAEVANTASVAISRGRSLQSAFDPILHALIHSLDFTVVALRSKALRGLSSVVTADPNLLALTHVRQAIEERLSDSSPAVRDAAVELIGKYVVQKPMLAKEYYPQLALRINDSGLSVRKRVIKLLRGIFTTTESSDIRADICCKMILMIGDQDEGVKELALKGLSEMLYAPYGDTAGLLVEVISVYSGSNASLESALHEVAKESEKTGQSTRGADTVDALINRLIDATEQADFDSLSHTRAISLLCAGQPALIDIKKATVLLSYLRPPANSDDQACNDLLLKIFRTSIPTMPRTASNFATDLTKALIPMISKPTGGLPALKETIGCFCVVTNHLTRDYTKLLTVLRACEGKVRAMKHQFDKTGALNVPNQAAAMTLYITALIAEYCNLDQIALEDNAVRDGVAALARGKPLFEHLYEMFLAFCKMPIPQTAPTICLGSLFRAYPSLILREETSTWMDQVFASNDVDNHARLLGSIHEFLSSQAAKRAAAGDKSKDMQALIGSTSDLTESGLSTAVVQRHIGHILDGAKSHHVPTLNSAMDVLSFTVNQGLYHPLQCMPILISLETSDDPIVAERALGLHLTLHQKHSTLVNVRFLDFAKASYDYQRSITSEVSGIRDGQALLAGWFGIISEKRAWKHDFLKALGRGFDYEFGRSTKVDPGFVLYLSENLSAFEYKLQEEVMTVIQALSQIVSTCAPIASILEKCSVEGDDDSQIEGRQLVLDDAEQDIMDAQSVIHASVVVCLALLTKNHLLQVYSLTEDKCLKHQPGKKSALGDKPATRRHIGGFDTSRIQFARGVATVGDFNAQKATFLQLLEEDGTVDLDV